MNILSISMANHDTSFCILSDGKIIINSFEERFSGIKNDTFLYSGMSVIKNFHNTYGIDLIVLSNISNHEIDYLHKCFYKYEMNMIECIISNDVHHLYHASSAFYASGFDHAICLVIDGWGVNYSEEQVMNFINDSDSQDNFKGEFSFNESATVYHAEYPCKFNTLYKKMFNCVNDSSSNAFLNDSFPQEIFDLTEKSNNFDINSSYDIGVVYGSLTKHLGWNREDCGKTMGLSSYGEEDLNLPVFMDDHGWANMNLFHSSTRIVNTINYPQMRHNNDFKKKANIAYKLQKDTERVLLNLIEKITKNDPEQKNIVFSGGCALNICANSKIKEKYPHINFYVDPVANDKCQAYGAAMYTYYNLTKSMKKNPLNSIYHGRYYHPTILKKEIELAVSNLDKNQTK